MKYKNKNRKKAKLLRSQLLSLLSIDEIAMRLAPHEYDSIVALDSAPERVELLIALAIAGSWLEELVEAARIHSYVSSNVDAQLASANPAHRLLKHHSSRTPVFNNSEPHDVLDLTIQTDFDRVNGGDADNDQSPGTLSYVDPKSGETVSVDCLVKARGKSRRLCGWRPLRFHFNGNTKGTIFAGTGRFIDFVTHCGYRHGQWEGLAGKDEAEHDRRLHQEFAFYQIIRAFGGMTLETRLVSTTYKDPAGNILENRHGFIRERKNRAPRRCGLKRQENDEGDPYLAANATSLFQAEFHHKLIFNDDYDFPNAERNAVRMTDGNEDFYFPYDFDMSGVIEIKNQGLTIQQNADELLKWLRQQKQSLARTQVAEVLSKETELRKLIAGTTADAIGKAELYDWLQTLLARLKEIFYSWSRSEKTPGPSSNTSPVLASYDGLMHLVHTGDSTNDIWHSTWGGNAWSPKKRIPERQSKSHPALANHGGQLHMVHADSSSNGIWHSIWDGHVWSPSERIQGQSTSAPCALASYGGLLHLIYTGHSPYDIWHSTWDGNAWSPKQPLPKQQSKSHPALANHGGNLHMVHAEPSSNSIWHSIWDGHTWSPNEKIHGQSSSTPCALASYGGLLHLLCIGDAGTDIGHSIWDGSAWSPQVNIPNKQSKHHPALVKHGGHLHMAYTDESSNNILTSIWCLDD